MEQERREHLEQIPEGDWEKTPASVKQLVETMQQSLETMASQLAEVLAVQEGFFCKNPRERGLRN